MAGDDAAEVAWVPLAEVAASSRWSAGLAEFLHDKGGSARSAVALDRLGLSCAGMSDVIVSEAVTFEVRGHYAVITINRPEARNAVNGAVANGIEAGIDRIEEDDAIWVGILTGAPPVFCAGADLKEINSGNAAGLQTKRGGFGGIVARERTKPIIAAVDGPALAGGTEITLACDLIVASTSATFGIPEVKRSLVAARRRPVPPRPQDPLQPRHGVRPDRRPDHRRGRPTTTGSSTCSPRPAGRSRRPSPWPTASAPTPRSRSGPPARSCSRPPTPPTRSGGRCRPRAWPRRWERGPRGGPHRVHREAPAGVDGQVR